MIITLKLDEGCGRGPTLIARVVIENFKAFRRFELELNDDINIIIGNNESGKTTILEAIHLAMTLRLNGRTLQIPDLSPYLFNTEAVEEFVQQVQEGENPEPPRILVEVYFNDTADEVQQLRGSNNSRREDAVGVRVEIRFNDEFSEEYAKLLENPDALFLVPVEYYTVDWYSFANSRLTSRSLGLRAFYIDSTSLKFQNGADYYLQRVINETLAPKDRVLLAMAYRTLKHSFADAAQIKAINAELAAHRLTEKKLSLSLDISPRSGWESSLIPYLDDVPFPFIGQGGQHVLKTLWALKRSVSDEDRVVLLEEPENHLSFSAMNKLISQVQQQLPGRQLIATTHSPYILNKLGIEHLLLLANGRPTKIANLSKSTREYFKKLPGYDTLRIILAKKAILVEGPSDELIVQKAYKIKYGKLPIQDEIDVMSVRGLSFKRFLDIAVALQLDVVVVTDNDANSARVARNYADYTKHSNIRICYSSDDALHTLERHMAEVNPLATLNSVFGTKLTSKIDMADHMINHKTDCAMKIFDTDKEIVFPGYINDAIE